jgi:hypothetical protein
MARSGLRDSLVAAVVAFALLAAPLPALATLAIEITATGGYSASPLLGDNYICALTTITPEHPNGRGDASYLADTPVVRRGQPGCERRTRR